MAKPQTPNQKKAYNALNTRLNRYVARVQSIYDKLNQQAATIAQATGYQGGTPFHFSDYPKVAKMVNDLMGDFVGGLQSLIYAGTSYEWKQSNIMQDLLAKKVMRYYDAQIDGEKQRVYFQSNSDALKAFQQRTERGMNLSTKLWDQSGNYKQELEYAISAAIEKGTSSVTLSKQLSQYLNDFPSLKADYTNMFGHAVDCHDCEYRSIRLARSEINMAYRTAEQTRWRQFDFILGYEIKLSGSHPAEDICDSLAGRYPKDFVWTGWHPNDMCYSVPIVMSEDDYWKMREGNGNGQDNMITDLPDCMRKYVSEHSEQIRQAQERGTLPYWLRDNKNLILASKDEVSNSSLIDPVKSWLNTWYDKKINKEIQEKDVLAFLDANLGKVSVRGVLEGFYVDRLNFEGSIMRTITKKMEDGSYRHRIFISNTSNKVIGANGEITTFNAMRELQGAMEAIRANKSLTFNQEYALESIWHELRHAKAKNWRVLAEKHSSIQIISIEVVNQFCARRSYAGFLKRKGIVAQHQDAILKSGYGYKQELSNFYSILEKYHISENSVYTYFSNRIIVNDYDMIFDNLVKFLEKQKVKNARKLIEKLGWNSEKFQLFMNGI